MNQNKSLLGPLLVCFCLMSLQVDADRKVFREGDHGKTQNKNRPFFQAWYIKIWIHKSALRFLVFFLHCNSVNAVVYVWTIVNTLMANCNTVEALPSVYFREVKILAWPSTQDKYPSDSIYNFTNLTYIEIHSWRIFLDSACTLPTVCYKHRIYYPGIRSWLCTIFCSNQIQIYNSKNWSEN